MHRTGGTETSQVVKRGGLFFLDRRENVHPKPRPGVARSETRGDVNGVGEKRRKKQHRRSLALSVCLARSDISPRSDRRTERERERESARASERRDGMDGTGDERTRQGERRATQHFFTRQYYAARDLMAPDLPYIDTARPRYPESHCPVRVGQHFHTYIYGAESQSNFRRSDHV